MLRLDFRLYVSERAEARSAYTTTFLSLSLSLFISFSLFLSVKRSHWPANWFLHYTQDLYVSPCPPRSLRKLCSLLSSRRVCLSFAPLIRNWTNEVTGNWKPAGKIMVLLFFLFFHCFLFPSSLLDTNFVYLHRSLLLADEEQTYREKLAKCFNWKKNNILSNRHPRWKDYLKLHNWRASEFLELLNITFNVQPRGEW